MKQSTFHSDDGFTNEEYEEVESQDGDDGEDRECKYQDDMTFGTVETFPAKRKQQKARHLFTSLFV